MRRTRIIDVATDECATGAVDGSVDDALPDLGKRRLLGLAGVVASIASSCGLIKTADEPGAAGDAPVAPPEPNPDGEPAPQVDAPSTQPDRSEPRASLPDGWNGDAADPQLPGDFSLPDDWSPFGNGPDELGFVLDPEVPSASPIIVPLPTAPLPTSPAPTSGPDPIAAPAPTPVPQPSPTAPPQSPKPAPGNEPPPPYQPTPPPATPEPPPAPRPTPEPVPTPQPIASAEIIANRATMGPTPGLIAQVDQLGAAAWIDMQLAPASIDDSAVDAMIAGYATLSNTNVQNYGILRGDPDLGLGIQRIYGELRHATFLRQVYSQRQLYEVMVDFWSNHFTVYLEDSYSFAHLTTETDRVVSRAHALGRFDQMLLASASSPGMLTYLHNYRSNANSSSGVNENYGRELLELHTLGIINGSQIYSEQDVVAASLVLSGWSIDESNDVDVFVFRDNYHHDGPVSILGGAWSRPDRAGATAAVKRADGESLLMFLAHHPRTAEYLSWKLCRRMFADAPPQALIDRLASVFLANNTAIGPWVRELLTSPELAAASGTKLRRGLETLTAFMRTTGALIDTDPLGGASETIHGLSYYEGTLEQLRQQLFGHSPPDGYPEDEADWVSADGSLRRWEIAGALAHNALARNDAAGSIVVDLSALLPSPLPATWGGLVSQMITRLTALVPTAVERDAILTRTGHVATDALAAADLTDGDLVADIVGLCLCLPRFHRR